MEVEVYEIREIMNWGEQPIATVWDEARANAYVAPRDDHIVVPVRMSEEAALAVAE